MKAHLEPTVSILRIYAEGKNREQFDPYEFSATIKHIDDNTIEICGVDKPVTPSIWRAIHELCQEKGITKVEFDRAAGDRKGKHTIRESKQK